MTICSSFHVKMQPKVIANVWLQKYVLEVNVSACLKPHTVPGSDCLVLFLIYIFCLWLIVTQNQQTEFTATFKKKIKNTKLITLAFSRKLQLLSNQLC